MSKLDDLFKAVKILADTFRVRFQVEYLQRHRVKRPNSDKWRCIVMGQRFVDADLSVCLKMAVKYVYETKQPNEKEETNPQVEE